MIDIVAYLALAISLIAISFKSMLPFRIVHLLASALYAFYGLFIEAYPIALGGLLFMFIHIYRIYSLLKLHKTITKTEGSNEDFVR